MTVAPRPASADGLLEAVSGDVETRYSLLSTRTRDASGTSTRTEISSYGARANLRVNYNLLPKLNLNAGLSYETDLSDPSGDEAGADTEVTRFRPSVWLTLRDPVLGGALGYDLRDETVKTSGLPDIGLTRETYAGNLHWRPADLPSTQLRYTRTTTRDDPRASVDTTEDYLFLKEEYLYRGLRASYTGTYLRAEDAIRDVESSQWSHEGNLLYETTFLDGRVSVATNDRILVIQLDNVPRLPVPPVAGLSGLDDTPLDGPPLAPNPALVDGDLTTSAGVNIGYPGPGGDFARRNVGLDFLTPVEVNRLHVWVEGFGPENLPADIATSFSWDVYTSRDNLTWTFHATVPAVFGPFDRRFDIRVPAVRTRYIKVVTRPLPGGVIGATNSSLYRTIFVTELQGFVERDAREDGTQTVQNYNLDVKVVLLRVPFLYYRLNASYYRFDSGAEADVQTRYNMAHGLFLTHRLTPILSTSASTSFEIGREADATRTAVLYYASLAATPLRTLTNTLTVSGSAQWLGGATATSNSVVLYNVAQLYRGIDASLNLGAVFTTEEQGAGPRVTAPSPGSGGPAGPPRPRPPNPGSLLDDPASGALVVRQEVDDGDGTVVRRDLYVNLGTGITPHPSLTLTGYYLGKLSHVSGGPGGSRDTTEHRLDLGLSFTPFRTLALSAAVSVEAETDRDTTVRQNYGLSWAPFPDGRLQFSFYYAENYFPEHSRTIQPTLRWYFGAARRSYLEASYQFHTTESDSLETESHLFSAGLRIFF